MSDDGNKILIVLAIITFIVFLFILPGKKPSFFVDVAKNFFLWCLIGVVPAVVISYISGISQTGLLTGLLIISLLKAMGDAHNESRR